MYSTKEFKKAALLQLKGRWKIPCIATLILVVVSMLISGASNGSEGSFIGFIILALVNGASALAYTNLFTLMHLSGAPVKFSDFTEGYSQFVRGFLGFLWTYLWIFLWSLLFFIPGIVKSFAYSQIFFILSDNPDIGVAKALNLSKVMTKGHKGDLFVLSLSFIGWYLLGILTCGIAFIWIIPYVTMTLTNSYYYLKQEALRTGKLTPADFE